MIQHILQSIGFVTLAIGMASLWSCDYIFAYKSSWNIEDFLSGVVIFLAIEGIVAFFILGWLL